MKPGVLLEDLTWVEAEQLLTEDTVVVIPLGAAAKEHGPHLKLKNDWLIAEYLKHRVIDQANVVVAPTVSYCFYPAFVDYPGSISIDKQTSSQLIMDICLSLAKFGPKRFYVLNTGVSTLQALAPAAQMLSVKGVLLLYTDLEKTIRAAVAEVTEQEGGAHADEIETSMMLYIAPETVDMSKAVKDFDSRGAGKLSRQQIAGLTYSPTGIWGDASLATGDKGKRVVQSLVSGILEDIERLQHSVLPTSTSENA